MAGNTDQRWAEEVKGHPEYETALRAKPSSWLLYMRYAVLAVFGFVFAAGSLFLSLVSPPGDRVPEAFRVAWSVGTLIFTAVGVGMVGYGLFRFFKISTTPLQSAPGLIVDKRLHVSRTHGTDSRGGTTSSSSTTYYVTLESEDGRRREFVTRGKLYGAIRQDDTGVAHVRDRYLLGYRRLPPSGGGP